MASAWLVTHAKGSSDVFDTTRRRDTANTRRTRGEEDQKSGGKNSTDGREGRGGMQKSRRRIPRTHEQPSSPLFRRPTRGNMTEKRIRVSSGNATEKPTTSKRGL